ncbi:MAG: hypothetical protein LBU60_00135 [Clostridiales bacterium]|jgi:hypothetical protein|nr:hypothetical protein [Clostridiales bacterium]
MRTRKRFFIAITLMLILALVLPSFYKYDFSIVPSTSVSIAKSNFDDSPDYSRIDLSIANSNFETDSTTLPANAESWTASALSNSTNSQNIISGILQNTSDSFARNKRNYGLDKYTEYDHTYPKTPFGEINTPGTSKSSLFINTNGLNTAYGYQSSQLDFAANSFYLLSVWVRTGDFAAYTGASITLDGLEDQLSFVNINTYNPFATQDNNYNWREYRFFVQTGFMGASARLVLGVGSGDFNGNPNGFAQARGYAMFANAQAWQLSPINFFNQTNDRQNIATLDNFSSVNDRVNIAGTTHSFLYNPTSRRTINTVNKDNEIEIKKGAALAPLLVDGRINNQIGFNGHDRQAAWTSYGANQTIWNGATPISDNPFNLPSNPFSPDLTQSTDVLLMSTWNSATNKFDNRVMYDKSHDLEILQHQYYLFSVWVRPMDVSNGIGAYIEVSGQNNVDADSYELSVFDREISATENSSTYNWVKREFYIQGSAINNRTINITLGLGHQIHGSASGNVLWANPIMESISYEQFASNYEKGTVVTFDEENATNISNGNFNNAGYFERYQYPLAPADWEYVEPEFSNTAGWSNAPVDTMHSISGIVPVGGIVGGENFLRHYHQQKLTNPRYTNIIMPNNFTSIVPPNNLMYMYSPTPTAYGFRSIPFDMSTEGGETKAIQVSLLVQDMQGYGANLVLRNNDNIVSTIEQIRDTGDNFKTFTFFVETGNNVLENLTLEVWLGLGDGIANTTKLSSGHVWINVADKVELEEGLLSQRQFLSGITTFDELVTRYSNLLKSTTALPFSVYTNTRHTFLSFDKYTHQLLKQTSDYNLSSLGSPAVVDSSNTRMGVFHITDALGNSTFGGNDLIPTNWVPNPNASANSTVQYIRDTNLSQYRHDINNDYPYVLMMQNTSPTASSLTSPIDFKTEANSFYRVSVKLKANLDDLKSSDDKIGLGIKLGGTDFAFADIKDTRDILDSENRDYLGWWNDSYKTYEFLVSTGSKSPNLSVEFTLGGFGHSREYVAATVYINDIQFETLESTEFDAAINKIDFDAQADYIEGGILTVGNTYASSLYADLEKGILDPKPPTEESTAGTINWWLVPSILFAIVIVLLFIIIILNYATKRSEAKSNPTPVIVPKRVDYDRNVAMRKATLTEQEYDLDSVYDLFDEDRPILQKTKVSKKLEKSEVEYEEVQIIEEVEVEVPQEEIIQEIKSDDEEQGAVITQLDDYYSPTKKILTKQTVVKTVKRPVIKSKDTNDFIDSFDD